ncbi:YcaO-like family protein [Roseivivax sediminis]|uniref:Ribosomal protein S12 methylthiotransferase accessory factor n=1 Tax=Roseivivax sediminis TaxID=936889 RepID=A0A1I1WFQ9_9RHOB|nr:YcaO-like family protein [Roseivivax sediminis]SFD91920.1 ribosomal protein S12 methylthiotransferase accessory factor [Roseivivax sediminis]
MNPVLDLDMDHLRARYPFQRLLMPQGGLLSGASKMAPDRGSPDLHVAVTDIGNMTKVFPHVIKPDGNDVVDEPMGGAGADLDEEMAWLRAVMEGAERYANMAYESEDDFVVASGNEVGELGIDLDTIARCSDAEYADPACPFNPPDKSLPIRWTRGWSLTHERERWVPTVMTHLYARPSRNERFWQEISTGVAAHVDLSSAIVSALCEVIERDALAILWLAQLPLPRIEVPVPRPPALADNHRMLDQSLVRQHFFDATSDLEVPTVYSLQLVENHPKLAQYVNCATGFDPATLVAKTIREAAPARPVLQQQANMPENFDDYRALSDGAGMLGRPEWRQAFDFLTRSPNSIALGEMTAPGAERPADQVRYILDRLSAQGFEAVICDLTTDELRDMGIWVVRAVIPGLMPMSVVQKGRFLGTPRLYDYPRRAGFGALDEADINPLPQPFA